MHFKTQAPFFVFFFVFSLNARAVEVGDYVFVKRSDVNQSPIAKVDSESGPAEKSMMNVTAHSINNDGTRIDRPIKMPIKEYERDTPAVVMQLLKYKRVCEQKVTELENQQKKKWLSDKNLKEGIKNYKDFNDKIDNELTSLHAVSHTIEAKGVEVDWTKIDLSKAEGLARALKLDPVLKDVPAIIKPPTVTNDFVTPGGPLKDQVNQIQHEVKVKVEPVKIEGKKANILRDKDEIKEDGEEGHSILPPGGAAAGRAQ